MADQVPARSYRKGISRSKILDAFPNEDAAIRWFEAVSWPNGEIACLKCGGTNAYRVKSGSSQPYRCRDCRRYFSLKTNTAFESSNVTLRQWAIGIYLVCMNLESMSSMKLHRELGVTQKTAWFMLHRIREAFDNVSAPDFMAPMKDREKEVGGLDDLVTGVEHKKLKAAHGTIGKTAVAGMRDQTTGKMRAQVVSSDNRETIE